MPPPSASSTSSHKRSIDSAEFGGPGDPSGTSDKRHRRNESGEHGNETMVEPMEEEEFDQDNDSNLIGETRSWKELLAKLKQSGKEAGTRDWALAVASGVEWMDED